MRFIAEMLDQSDVINYLVEFGFEDVGPVYPDDGVMYVNGIAVLIASVKVAQDIAPLQDEEPEPPERSEPDQIRLDEEYELGRIMADDEELVF